MSTDVLAPSREPRVAEIAPPEGAPPATAQPAVPIRIRLAHWMHAQGVSPGALLVFSLVFAVTAALVLLAHHPGIAAVLGFVALGASELARVPAGAVYRDTRTLARAVVPLVDLLFVAGVVGDVAGRSAPFVLFLALVVFVLEAWLPMLRAIGGPLRLADTSGLWTRSDRLTILLLGALIGRMGPALLFVGAVGILDAWLRLERIDLPAGVRPDLESSWARVLLREDGSFVSLARWISLGLAAILLLLLPISGVWRF
jgi:hypothetical protein